MTCSFFDNPMDTKCAAPGFKANQKRASYGVFTTLKPTRLLKDEKLCFLRANGEFSNISFLPGQDNIGIMEEGTYRLRYGLCITSGQGSTVLCVNDQPFLESEREALNKCVDWCGVLTLEKEDKLSIVNTKGDLVICCATLELFRISL